MFLYIKISYFMTLIQIFCIFYWQYNLYVKSMVSCVELTKSYNIANGFSFWPEIKPKQKKKQRFFYIQIQNSQMFYIVLLTLLRKTLRRYSLFLILRLQCRYFRRLNK